MVWLPSTPITSASTTPSRRNSDASLSTNARSPTALMINEKPPPAYSWGMATSPTSGSRKYFDGLPFASQLSASANSGRFRVRIIALAGLVLATVLILANSSSSAVPDTPYTLNDTTQTSLTDARKAAAQIAQPSTNITSADSMYAIDEDDQASTYLGYAKKFAHEVKDEFAEYYEAAASVAGEVADKAHKMMKWSDIDDDADIIDDDEDVDEHLANEQANSDSSKGWLWQINAHKGKTHHKVSPDCIPPIRADFNGTPSDYSPLQQAFVKSWKNVCKLDQDKFTIIMTSSNGRAKVVRKWA